MRTVVEFRDVEISTSETSTDVDAPADAGDEKASTDEDTGGEDASSDAGIKIGDEVKVTSFQPGEQVKISGVSVGKGFQGTVRRHGFSRGPVTHGSHNVRAPGSIGASADPARVFPGQRMPGRMGARRATQLGSRIVEVDAERNLLLIRGSVPGPRNAIVEVRSAG
jgi:large subunit ribosomal protein L3